MTERATARDVRRRNRSALLTRLYFGGPSSRPELSQVTGLSAATVSNLTGALIADGLLEEAGSIDSDGGRPRTLLRIAPNFGYVVGVDVGETRVQVELFDLGMTALAKADSPIDTERPSPEDTVDRILAGLNEVISSAGVASEQVLGAGIGVIGLVSRGSGAPDDGAVVYAPTIGWDAIQLESMLRTETSVPLHIDNGAKTLGQAEMWFGAGKGTRHAVIALVGSGVGAAVVVNGERYRGANSSAGEWGHTTLMYGGRPCRCGSRGCLEAYVGAEGILARFREANHGRGLAGTDEESAIETLLSSDSPVASRILTETAAYLGAGIADLVNLFNPERVILGGWAGLALGRKLLPSIRSTARSRALRQPFSQTTIELCQLGPDAVAVGAATLPIAKLLAPG